MNVLVRVLEISSIYSLIQWSKMALCTYKHTFKKKKKKKTTPVSLSRNHETGTWDNPQMLLWAVSCGGTIFSLSNFSWQPLEEDPVFSDSVGCKHWRFPPRLSCDISWLQLVSHSVLESSWLTTIISHKLYLLNEILVALFQVMLWEGNVSHAAFVFTRPALILQHWHKYATINGWRHFHVV